MQINYDKQSNVLLKNDNLVKNYEIQTVIKNYTLNSYFKDAIWGSYQAQYKRKLESWNSTKFLHPSLSCKVRLSGNFNKIFRNVFAQTFNKTK